MKQVKYLFFTLLVVLVLTGCTTSGYQSDTNRVEEETLILGENESAITRTNISVDEDMESIIENKENYSINAQYPVLHKPHIDETVKAQIYQWLDEFVDDMEDHQGGNKGELTITYEIARPIEDLASIQFECLSTTEVGVEGQRTFAVYNVDVSRDQVLTLNDIFDSSPLPIIGRSMTNWFQVSNDFNHKLDEPMLKTQVEIAAAGDGLYRLGDYSFQVIFQEDSLLPRSHHTVWIDIPYNTFADYLAPKYQDLKEIIAPIGDDSYIVTQSLPSPYVSQRYREQCRARGIDVSHIDPTKPMVALTFDDGPNDTSTVRILDTLKKYDVRGTFFVLGRKVEQYPEVLERMAAEHHDIGNHSFTHANLTELDEAGLSDELERTEQLVYNESGYNLKFIRPTYGAMNETLVDFVDQPLILWSVDTLDWSSRHAESITREVMNHVSDGDIILMHDIYNSTADALEIFLPKLIDEGYQLVTVSELYYLRGQALEPKVPYFSNAMMTE